MPSKYHYNVSRTTARCVVVTAVIFTMTALAACSDSDSEAVGKDEHSSGIVTKVAHVHAKDGETCFICDPIKRETGRLWCKEHGRYEDRCWLCHPELQDKGRPYCNEHFLYEDECGLCRPEVKTPSIGDAAGAPSQATGSALFCSEHTVAESECGICQPGLASSLEPGQSLLVRMPSANSASKAGVRIERPRRSELMPGVEALCEADYNRNAMTRITPLTSGVIIRVAVDVGDRVEAGELLAELHSAEVARAKSGYLATLVNRDIRKQTFERERNLAKESIGARKDLLQAEADYRVARLDARCSRQMLVNLGLSAEAIAEIERSDDASATYTLRAPFSGTLTDRAAVAGQAVASGEALFTLTDLSSRWLTLSLPADRLQDIRVGQPVSVEFDDLPGEEVRGELAWVDAAVDPRTRLVRARAVTTHDVGRVKAGMFGRAKIFTGSTVPGVLVPSEAVQYHERHPYVFVRREPDLFALRRVTVGTAAANTTEILSGLHPDEAVVASGFLVMSEFLKSRLGAGCVDD